MTEPAVTSWLCAVAIPHRDNVPIKTSNPARASRRKYAADSMAIKPLQKLSIHFHASRPWPARILKPPYNRGPNLFRQTSKTLARHPLLRQFPPIAGGRRSHSLKRILCTEFDQPRSVFVGRDSELLYS